MRESCSNLTVRSTLFEMTWDDQARRGVTWSGLVIPVDYTQNDDIVRHCVVRATDQWFPIADICSATTSSGSVSGEGGGRSRLRDVIFMLIGLEWTKHSPYRASLVKPRARSSVCVPVPVHGMPRQWSSEVHSLPRRVVLVTHPPRGSQRWLLVPLSA